MRKSQTINDIPKAGEGKRGAHGHLGYLLRQANVAFRSRLERALSKAGLTQPQFVVMTMVEAYPGCSSADIARLSLLTAQTVTVIVSNLQRDGLLEATPHPVHGRIRCLDLTPRGRKMLKQGKARANALEAELADCLSPAEEIIVRRWLAQAAIGQANRPPTRPLQARFKARSTRSKNSGGLSSIG